MAVVMVIVIDNRGLVIDMGYPCTRNTVSMPAIGHKVSLWYEDPEVKRQVDRHTYIQTGH